MQFQTTHDRKSMGSKRLYADVRSTWEDMNVCLAGLKCSSQQIVQEMSLHLEIWKYFVVVAFGY